MDGLGLEAMSDFFQVSGFALQHPEIPECHLFCELFQNLPKSDDPATKERFLSAFTMAQTAYIKYNGTPPSPVIVNDQFNEQNFIDSQQQFINAVNNPK